MASIYKSEKANITSEVIINILDGEKYNLSKGDYFNVTAIATTANLTIQGIKMDLTINGQDKGSFSFANGKYFKVYQIDFEGMVTASAHVTDEYIPNYYS